MPRFNAYFPCQLQYISFNVTSENLVVHQPNALWEFSQVHQPNALSRFSTPHHDVLIRLRRNWMLVSLKYSHTKKGENLRANVEICYDNFVTATSRQFFTLWARVSFSMIMVIRQLKHEISAEISARDICSSNHFSRKQIKLNM